MNKTQSEQIEGRQRSTTMGLSSSNKERMRLDDFDLLEVLGHGAFGEVHLVRRKSDKGKKDFRALKFINRNILEKENKLHHLFIERTVLEGKFLDKEDYKRFIEKREFLIMLHSYFEDATTIYMELEICPNGEFADYLNHEGKLSREEAQFFAAQMVVI